MVLLAAAGERPLLPLSQTGRGSGADDSLPLVLPLVKRRMKWHRATVQQDARPLLSKWRVEQMQQGQHRPLADIIRGFEGIVTHVARNVQAQLASTPETTVANTAIHRAATRECLEGARSWLAT